MYVLAEFIATSESLYWVGGGGELAMSENWIIIIRNQNVSNKKLKSLFLKILTISKTNKPLAHIQGSCLVLLYNNRRNMLERVC
jgi:hypothetical protein